MRASRVVLRGPEVAVAEVHCDGDEVTWSAEESVTNFGIVLVRRGLFRRRVDGVESLADAASAYLQVSGSTQQMAHPCGGDVCTFLALSRTLLGSLVDQAERAPASTHLLFTTSATGLAHRLLLGRAAQGADAFELTERATALGGELLHAVASDDALDGRTPSPRTRAIVDRARQELSTDLHLGLGDLARRAGVSAFYLSRIFRRATGWTLSRYRAELRRRRALERLAAGERNLANLAAELGYSDQAHLTRSLRSAIGATPGALRSQLDGG